MAEQRQPFRFRIPWLPGTSVPPRAPSEATQRPVMEAPVAVERIPFQPSARPPFRPAGIAQVPPPPKVPSPPRKAPQPPFRPAGIAQVPPPPKVPSPPRKAPQSSPPPRPITQPEVVAWQDTTTPTLVPSRPEVPSAILSQSSRGAAPEGNLKSNAMGSILETAPPKETLLPSTSVPQSSNEKPAKSVDSASLSAPLKVEPPALQERSSFSSISRPSGESQGPFGGIISKLQEKKRVEATDQEEAPTEAASSVANSEKIKEKDTTHPPALPSASASQEPKRSKQMKIIPKRQAVTSSYYQSNTNHLVSRPRPAAVRGSGSSSSSSSFHKEIKDDVSKFVHLITSGKENTSTMQNSVEAITLAGENTGATMQLTSKSSERKELIHIPGNYRSNLDESIGGTTDVEEEEEEEREVNGEGEEESENSAFLNSNVQGLNNSIVLDSSVSEGSPGVYFERALNAELQLESHSESHKEEMPRRTSQ